MHIASVLHCSAVSRFSISCGVILLIIATVTLLFNNFVTAVIGTYLVLELTMVLRVSACLIYSVQHVV